jgi:diaminopimelate decarboxylase
MRLCLPRKMPQTIQPQSNPNPKESRKLMSHLYPVAHLNQRDDALYLEGVALNDVAREFGTPLYVYSKAALQDAWSAWEYAVDDRQMHVCYAVKACSNLSILRLFAERGAFFDTVSEGEIARVLAVGVPADRIVFSGVAKSEFEIEFALKQGIFCFNVESVPELERVHAIAMRLGVRAPISLRVNPDVDAKTHPYISTGLKANKFGISHTEALAVYQQAAQLTGLEIIGIDYHIGSQITELSPFLDAQNRLFELVKQLANVGIVLKHIDLGGGLGVRYQDETPPLPRELIEQSLRGLREAGLTQDLMFEPGRSLVANACVLLTQVEYLKPTEAKNFCLVDAGMNDFIRPSLYQAWVGVENCTVRDAGTAQMYDVVGPVCETGDWLARERTLAVAQGDVLAVLSTGAYGFSMASNYNTRARAAEVLVDGTAVRVIRRREVLADLWALEL